MDQEDFYKLVGMLSQIFYEMAHKDFVDEELREMLLDFWRYYDSFYSFYRARKEALEED